jgi:hypothetical protein
MTDRPSFTAQTIQTRQDQVKAVKSIAATEAEILAALRNGLPTYAPDRAATYAALTRWVRDLAKVNAA